MRRNDKTGKPVRRRLYVLLICFAISILLWLISVLNTVNITQIPVKVVYKNMSRSVSRKPLPDVVYLEIKGSGFELIRRKFELSGHKIVLDVSDEDVDISNKKLLSYALLAAAKKQLNETENEISYVKVSLQKK